MTFVDTENCCALTIPDIDTESIAKRTVFTASRFMTDYLYL